MGCMGPLSVSLFFAFFAGLAMSAQREAGSTPQGFQILKNTCTQTQYLELQQMRLNVRQMAVSAMGEIDASADRDPYFLFFGNSSDVARVRAVFAAINETTYHQGPLVRIKCGQDTDLCEWRTSKGAYLVRAHTSPYVKPALIVVCPSTFEHAWSHAIDCVFPTHPNLEWLESEGLEDTLLHELLHALSFYTGSIGLLIADIARTVGKSSALAGSPELAYQWSGKPDWTVMNNADSYKFFAKESWRVHMERQYKMRDALPLGKWLPCWQKEGEHIDRTELRRLLNHADMDNIPDVDEFLYSDDEDP